MLRTLKITFIILSSNISYGQMDSCLYHVNGKIMDLDTKLPIPYVAVKVRDSNKFTITNKKGEFFIDGLCKQTNMLIISCYGYCNTMCEQEHQHGKTPHIYLKKEILELENITIQATVSKNEATESISQIELSKDQLAHNFTESMASFIAQHQGISLTSSGVNVQIPVIHGLYGNRILIMNNGLKHGFQNWGKDHAPEINLSLANKITVIKGATGVRYGPEALGGAIVVESNPLYLNEPFYAEFGSGFQSNGRGINTSLEIGKGGAKSSYFLNGSLIKNGDRHTPDYMLTNSGKKEYALAFGSRYHLNNWDLKIHYSMVNQNLALLRASIAESGNAFIRAIDSKEPIYVKPFSYDINAPNQLLEHHMGKMEVNWIYSNKGKFTFRTGTQLNKREEYDVRRNVDKPIIDLNLITTEYQLEWKHPDWAKLDGLLGVQYFVQNNYNNPGTGTTPFIPNYQTNRLSAFLVESRRVGENIFEMGVRIDYESNSVGGRETNQAVFRDKFSFFNLTSSLGIVSELTRNTILRSNIGTAWRAPNMSELYSFGQHGFKSSFGLLRYDFDENQNVSTDNVLKISNSQVLPEKGFKFINEIQIDKTKNSHKFTAYFHLIKNYIFERPFSVIGTIRGPMPVFVFQQTDAFFIGGEYTWFHNWTDKVSSLFGLSYLYSKNITHNQSLINQPPISSNFKVDFDLITSKKFNSKMVLDSRYIFRQFQAPKTVNPKQIIEGYLPNETNVEIFDFKETPNGYFIIDVSWNAKWKNFSGQISIKNLLNTRYRDYLNEMRYFTDELGRNFVLSLNYEIMN